MDELFPGIYRIDKKLATPNLVPGHTVYNEKTVNVNGIEYRFWDPYRSKLAAAINKGLKEVPITPGTSVLYLGAATGTTPSHISDIVGKEGTVYCVEFAQRVIRDLISVCETRENMLPILADARKPASYGEYIPQKVDCVYSDVAQPDQVRILSMNVDMFLKKGGKVLIAIKSQSIDVSRPPTAVYAEALKELEKKFEIIQKLELEPFEKDHLFVSLVPK
jgi:fibrillarin-like pre-rRNA processing protein